MALRQLNCHAFVALAASTAPGRHGHGRHELDPETGTRVIVGEFLPRLRRVGHEAGSLSPWLQPELAKRGLPAVCLETRHVRAAMSAQRNKTDAT
jgi:transposase